MTDALRKSPLDIRHRELGAKMTPFGGWDMPLQYSSVIDEHLACRGGAVVFDVSHLGTLLVSGPDAFDALQATLSNDLRRINVGRAQYTHLLDPHDAHVVDDIIVWWVRDEEFLVMPNASNTDRVVRALREHSLMTINSSLDRPLDFGLRDTTSERCVLALQGPTARELAAAIAEEIATVPRFGVAPFVWNGIPAIAAGTGYTGEDGIEVQVPADRALQLWDAVIQAGFTPAGLGARDTLRLEAGLPLHGHDLGPGITPLNAGLGWVVGWDKPAFSGHVALRAQREEGVAEKLVGLTIAGRQPPRADYEVLSNGAVVGRVSSGNFSPVLGCGVALAFVTTEALDVGHGAFHINMRGKLVAATRVPLPFVSRS